MSDGAAPSPSPDAPENPAPDDRPRGRPARERLQEARSTPRERAMARAARQQERDLDEFQGMDPILEFNVECPGCGDTHFVSLNLRAVLKPENIHFDDPDEPDGDPAGREVRYNG